MICHCESLKTLHLRTGRALDHSISQPWSQFEHPSAALPADTQSAGSRFEKTSLFHKPVGSATSLDVSPALKILPFPISQSLCLAKNDARDRPCSSLDRLPLRPPCFGTRKTACHNAETTNSEPSLAPRLFGPYRRYRHDIGLFGLILLSLWNFLFGQAINGTVLAVFAAHSMLPDKFSQSFIPWESCTDQTRGSETRTRLNIRTLI